MSSELRLRRGTDTQHDSFTGAEAEVTVNTINKSVHVHDGTTTGGFELARADLNNVENEVFAAKAAAAGVSGGGDFISSINGVTKANPAVVSVSSSHGYIDGQQITITGVGGMTQLNGNTYYADVLTTTTFALYSDIALTTTVNSTSYTTYTSGGETAGSVSAGAPISGSYVTINAESGMPNERRLQAGVGLTLTDSGAGGAVSVAANLAATAPSNLGSANAGASNVIARADHVHAMPTATDVGAVPTARTVSAGTGLSGGGALSSNITLSLNANLHMLTDVTIGTLANGDVIMYNEATSVFENSNTFAKSSILLNNANVAINSITKFNFIGTGLSATVNGSDATRIDLNFTGLLDTEGVQDIVGAMVESNTENGISVTYDDTTGKLNFDVDDPIITLSGDVTGTATMTNLGNVTISTTIAANSVALGADTTGNYIATITGANGISVTGSGVESAAITLEINPTEGNFVEAMQDLVGTMVSGNSESGIAVTYNDTLGKLDFAVGNPTVTLSGAITGAGTITNLANVTITTSIAENAVTLGTNTTGNYVANITANATAGYGGIVVSGSGSETAAVTIGINPANSDFIEGVQDIIGGMIESNTEAGIAVTYDDNTGKLNFDVADPVITISGVVNGSATMTNLGNVTITVTQANDSVALGTNTTGNYVATVAANATTGYGGIVVSGSGSETAAIVIGINPANADFAEGIQDIVGTMVETNTESGISVTYNDTTGKLNFDVADPVITLSGDVTGSATMTDLGNVTITTTIAANSVALGTDTTGNYVATVAATGGITVSGSGTETAAITIGINPANADFIEGVQDIVGSMVDTNTESGISVTYDDTNGKLNFDVADPVITLSGDVTGSATMTNLANVTITTTIAANSVELGTDTTGAYVANIAAGAGITVTGAGAENATATISVNTSETAFVEAMQDLIGGMVTTNTENGIDVTYIDDTGKLHFDVNDFQIQLTGDVTGQGTVTNLANVSFVTTIAANSVALGADTTGNYVATVAANATTGFGGIVVSGSGSETAAVVIGVDTTNADFAEGIQDIVGGMVIGNTENGITVVYDDDTGKLNFQIPNVTYTLTGDVTGAITTSNLANVTITTTIAANSVALGADTTGNYVANITANATTGYGGIVVSGSGSETANVVIGVDTTNADFAEGIQEIVGGMVTGNTENGITVTYNDGTNKLDFQIPNVTYTLTGDVTGSITTSNLGNVTITTTIPADSIALGADTTGNYVANITANATTGYGGIVVTNGVGEGSNTVIGIDPANADFIENMQDLIGGMVTTNTENGIAVTYNDITNKLDFDVNDFTITLGGDLTGSQTITNLGSITLNATIAANSVALGADTTGNYVANITANATTGYGGIVVTNGVGEGLTTVIGVDTTNADFAEGIQEIVGGMVTGGVENGIIVTYNDATNKLDFQIPNVTYTLSGDVTGTITVPNLGNVTITTTIAADSVALGTDTTGAYVANITANTAIGYSGITVSTNNVETAAVTIGIDTTNADFRNSVRDFVAPMFTTGNGLTVSYTDTATGGTVVINPNDPLITIAGSVSGSNVMTDLGATTITVTPVANAIVLGPHTTGNYVATIAANTAVGQGGITVSGSGQETAAVTIGLDTTNADFRNSVRDLVAPLFSTGNGISVVYTDTALGGSITLDPNDPVIAIAGAVIGSETMSNLSNTTITVAQANNSVTLGQHTVGAYVANITANASIGYGGITVSTNNVETAAVTIGLDTTNADFRNSIRDLVAPMFTTGNGLTISYTDTATGGTVVIDPNDPVIAIAGAVIGSETMSNLSNTTITVAQANNSVTLGQHTVGNYIANITANASIGYGGIVVSGSGSETANVVIGLDTTNADFRNSVRDLVAPLFSTGNGISVVYTDTALGGSITLDPNDPTISLSGVVTGSNVMTNLGSVGIVTTLSNDSVTLGQHTVGNYVANITANSNIGSAGILITSGVGEGSNTVIGLDSTNADFRNTIRDITRAIFPAGPSNGIDYVYNDTTNILTITPNNPTIAITGSVIGSQEMTALGNVSITVAQANNSVTLGTHTVGNYVANVTAGKGIAVVGANVETADITISVDTGEAQFVNDVQDIFGLMLSGNDESGVTVTYNPDTAKVNFDVNDPTITLTGDVSGSMQMVDLGSISITCTVADSSHDHVIANVIGLQAALDSKVGGADLALTGTTTVNNLNPSLNAAYSLGTTNFRFTNVWATTLNGTAVQAQYADLAERYHADAKYPIGTVVKLGGSKEITATTTENDPQVIGVVSENPAYLMNDGAGDPNEWPPIAMTGRVRVKIVGLVTKGQRIVSSNEPGVAMAVNDNELTSVMTVVGRALRSSTDPNIKLVECIIGKF